MKATFNGSPIWSSRLHGGSITFDGSSDLSLVAGTYVFNRASDNGPFTITAGVMQTGSQTGFQTIWGNGANGFYLNAGQVRFFSTATSRQVLSTNVPYVISASTSGPNTIAVADGEIAYSINGRLDSIADYVAFPQMSGATIGGHGTERFIGEISFLYIHDRFIPNGEQTGAAYNLHPTGKGGTMASLHADPFAMFYEQDVKRYASMGAFVGGGGLGGGAFNALLIAP